MPDKFQTPTNLPSPAVKHTIRQAKAAFNSRNCDPCTDRQTKQIERAAELNRRAWRTKHYEKRKAETARKKEEREKRHRDEVAKVMLGSQRRCDRFGIKSSQMHLGAFFGGMRRQHGEKDGTDAGDFGDVRTDCNQGSEQDEIDDDLLLDTLDEEPAADRHLDIAKADLTSTVLSDAGKQQDALKNLIQPVSSIARHTAEFRQTVPNPNAKVAPEDSLWSGFDSNSQIARELENPVQRSREEQIKSISFSSTECDITVEEIEEAAAIAMAKTAGQYECQLMPPPPVPIARLDGETSRSSTGKKNKRASNTSSPGPPLSEGAEHRPTTLSSSSGFSFSQLETFIDEDLQLTQVGPG